STSDPIRGGSVNRHAVRFPPPPRSLGGRRAQDHAVFPRGRGLTIKLEGELLGPRVGSLRDACAVRGRRPRRLGLAAVTYADAAGVQLLRDLIREGVEIAACSSFVGELLRPESWSMGAALAPVPGVRAG